MKKYAQILCSLTVLCTVFSTASFAQGYTPAQIDSIVNKTFEVSPAVGIAVAVVKDGKVIHSKGYGIAAYNTKKKVDENTLFAIASNSKAFTTTALSILVDEGKLYWNDKVIDYIPEFKMYDDYVTANFTITDLLTHRSGLGLGAGDLMFFPDGSDFTIKDVLNSFQYQKPQSAFRTKYDYDNLLYAVAGEVVKRVSGQSWPDFVQNHIFNPLGMTQSVPVSTRLPQNGNVAMPHNTYTETPKQLEIFEDTGDMAPAGGIYASVNNLTQWMLVQLNHGKYGKDLSKTLFTEERQQEMWQPYTNEGFSVMPQGSGNSHFQAYGLGWELYDLKGKIIVEHTGGLPGMLSRTILVPELNLGIVVLTNSDPGGYAYYSVPQTILSSYLDTDAKGLIPRVAEYANSKTNNADSVTNAVWEKVKNNKSMPFDKTSFTGTYKDNWFGEVTVTLKGDQLWFTCKRSPKLNGPMYYYNATTFAVKWEYQDMPCDAFAIFSLDEEGKATAIKMKGISPNIDFSFDFQDLDLQRVAD